MAHSRATTVVTWILSVLGAAAFVSVGVSKLAGAPAMVATFDTIGVGQWFRYVTGGIEVVGAVLLLVPALARWGALLLACTMIGAIVAHLTALHTSFAAPLGVV